MLALSPSERESVLSPGKDEGVYESYTVLTPPGWNVGLPQEVMRRYLSPGCDALRAFLEFAFGYLGQAHPSGGRAMTLAEALLEDVLFGVIGPAEKPSATSSDMRMRDIFDRSREVMAERFTHPISILDVARSVGVGERTLQKSFRACGGMTAREYLADLRLKAMREQLLSGDPGVS
ncbi:unnamed protein product, partial [Ectocarpus sp. 12 AP-2014]